MQRTLFALMLASCLLSPSLAQRPPRLVENQLFLILRPGTSLGQVNELARMVGGAVLVFYPTLREPRGIVVRGAQQQGQAAPETPPAAANLTAQASSLDPCGGALALIEVDGKNLAQALQELRRNDLVLYGDPQSIGDDDSDEDYRPQMGAGGTIPPGKGGASVTVAVLDNGATSGKVDVFNVRPGGYDFTTGVNGDPDASEDPAPARLHGSAIASLIAGKNWGMAPEANILPVRVCDENNECLASNVVRGTCWAISQVSGNGSDPKALRNLVLNYSLGGEHPIESLRALLAYALRHGALVAASGGNEGRRGFGAPPHFPAYYAPEFGGFLAVAGLWPSPRQPGKWERWPFSTIGPHLEIAAPAVVPLLGQIYRGTSYATGYVSGALALWRDACPDLSPADIEIRLARDAARTLLVGTVYRQLVGQGMLHMPNPMDC